MTDAPDAPDEQLDPLSRADEARIRALLSDARETGSMPAQVAARLDEAIIGLAAERERVLDSGYQANVTPLVRTKRHRAAAVLSAAAAVAVLGLGIGTFFDGDGQGDDGALPADSGVDRGTVGAETEDDSAREETPKRTEDGVSTKIAPELVIGAGPFPVHSRHLGRDLAQLRDRVLPDPRAADYTGETTYAPEGFTCRSMPAERSVLVGVRYDGAPAYAAFQEPMGESQVVEVLQCGTGDVLRSTTLPLPE